ncbi:hypothetical protein [Providencia rettgeri]|uniref:hypothetical protein n=1 Tax=Providencia rettgeri TaxID=587 RepID=UPI00235E38D4|nr:hypothetical protein [Providencia rettgeri]
MKYLLMRLLIILSFLFITACTTGDKISKVTVGMNKNDVIKILGNPDGISHQPPYEMLTYSNRMTAFYSDDKGDYHVVLENNKVVEYGVTNIRQGDTSARDRAEAARLSAERSLPQTTTCVDHYGNTVCHSM